MERIIAATQGQNGNTITRIGGDNLRYSSQYLQISGLGGGDNPSNLGQNGHLLEQSGGGNFRH